MFCDSDLPKIVIKIASYCVRLVHCTFTNNTSYCYFTSYIIISSTKTYTTLYKNTKTPNEATNRRKKNSLVILNILQNRYKIKSTANTNAALQMEFDQ